MMQDDRKYGLGGVSCVCMCNAVCSMIMLKGRSDILGSGKFRAKNVYGSLDKETMQVTFIFVGQTTLIAFMLYSVYEKFAVATSEAGHHVKTDDMAYVYWVAAYAAVQMSAIYNRG